MTTKSSYEFWDGSSWAASGAVALWGNSGPATIQFNAQEDRWVAVHSLATADILPYGLADTHSALAVRVASDLEGPWSAPVVVWERPQTDLNGTGSAHGPVLLPGLEAGSVVVVAANDDGEWTQQANAYLYEIDLSQIVFPPAIDNPPDPVTDNPYAVEGIADSGDTVRLFVNGEEEGTATAQADGSFSIPAILFDGSNSVYAVAEDQGESSLPSDTVTINYESDDDRTLTGPISIDVDTVWTPGTPSGGTTGPYVLSGGDLTIATGATLTVLPGVEVRVNGSQAIVVDRHAEPRLRRRRVRRRGDQPHRVRDVFPRKEALFRGR